jgi:hypothetical protein
VYGNKDLVQVLQNLYLTKAQCPEDIGWKKEQVKKKKGVNCCVHLRFAVCMALKPVRLLAFNT